VNSPETDPLMAKTLQMGRFFKTSVLGFDESHKAMAGGLQSDVNFESHRNSEKKGNKDKLVV
jgi:translation initiation factor 4E